MSDLNFNYPFKIIEQGAQQTYEENMAENPERLKLAEFLFSKQQLSINLQKAGLSNAEILNILKAVTSPKKMSAVLAKYKIPERTIPLVVDVTMINAIYRALSENPALETQELNNLELDEH